MSEEEKGFVIKDRRMFTEDGDKKEEKEIKTDSKAKVSESAEKKKESKKESAEDMPLPEINFSVFVFSLNSSALVQLGLIEDPATGQKIKNLPMAKQTIDIIGMLEEKTRGNLSKDEEGLMKSMLYDLRMLYVREKDKS